MTDHYPFWVDEDFFHNTREVAPRLFVGAIRSPILARQGRLGKVTLIVSLCGESEDINEQISRNRAYCSVPERIIRPFRDGEGFPGDLLDRIYDRTAAHLDAGGAVLIHCRAGLSRSVSAAYAVLRRREGLSHDAALDRVQGHPNFPCAGTLASARSWVHGMKG